MSFSDKNSLSPVAALQNTAIATDTDTDGIIIDTQNARDVNFLLQCNAFTDGTYTPTILTSSDSGMSGATTIAAADINGDTYNTALVPAADEVFHYSINRTAHERYVQLRVTSASTTSGADLSAVAVLGSLGKSVASSVNPS